MSASFVADLFVHSEEACGARDADAQVSWRCRSQCRPGTGAASEKRRPATGASVSSTYRNFTPSEPPCCGMLRVSPAFVS